MRKPRLFLSSSPQEYEDLFVKNKTPYKLEGYAHSEKIETKTSVYIFSKKFNKDVVPIFTKIKYNILKNKINNKIDFSKTPIPVFYITGKKMASMNIGDELKWNKVINIDIKKAYPSCLLLNGFIGQELYDYLLQKDKLTVLKSIGVLGTNKLSKIFNGKKHSIPTLTKKPYLGDVLKFIQYEIGRVMVKISNHYKKKNQFLFFWTDGIYLTPNASIKYAEKCMQELGYKYEVLNLPNFSINKYMGKHKPLLKIKFLKSKDDWKEFNIPEKKLSMYKEW